MTIIVDPQPLIPSAAAVQVGRPVSGREHHLIARAANYCRGRGCTLIPAYAPLVTVASGATATFNYKVWARGTAIARIWALRLRRAASVYGINAYLNVYVPSSGSAQRTEVRATAREERPMYYLETITSPTAGIQDASIKIDCNTNENAAGVIVESIACYELPRAELLASELGTNVETCRSGEPIFDGTGESLGALADSVSAIETQTHRGALWAWGVPDANALTTTGTSLADVFLIKPRILGTKVYRGDTTKTITVRARVKCGDGSTAGEIVLTSRLGATLTITIPAGTTSFAWLPSSSGTLAVDCEDLSTSNGRQSNAWEDVTVQWRRTAGTSSVQISALIFGDG